MNDIDGKKKEEKKKPEKDSEEGEGSDKDEDGSEKDDDKEVPLLDQPLEQSGTRERKKVQRFDEEFKGEAKEVSFIKKKLNSIILNQIIIIVIHKITK